MAKSKIQNNSNSTFLEGGKRKKAKKTSKKASKLIVLVSEEKKLDQETIYTSFVKMIKDSSGNILFMLAHQSKPIL